MLYKAFFLQTIRIFFLINLIEFNCKTYLYIKRGVFLCLKNLFIFGKRDRETILLYKET